MTVPAKLFEEPIARELAAKRALSRKVRRIPYDCMNAIVQGDEVVCKIGYPFPHPGRKGTKTTMKLLSVLRGSSNSVCQACLDYDGEETEG